MSSFYVNGRMMNFGSSNVVFSNGGISISGSGGEPPATRQQLCQRYPGVEFRGTSDSAQIQSSVRIAAGAIITLSPNLVITGDSKVGSQAVVSGGSINYSTIDGSVSGGSVNHSKVRHGGSVEGGSVNHSKVEDGGVVTGGSANHSTVRGTLGGGSLNHSTVANGQTVSGGSHNHENINGSSTSAPRGQSSSQVFAGNGGRIIVSGSSGGMNFSNISVNGNSVVTIGNGGGDFFGNSFSSQPTRSPQPVYSAHPDPVAPAATSLRPTSPNRLRLPPPMNVSIDEKFDEEPPEHLVDGLITYELINEAVMTPNGDTYDRKAIEREIARNGKCPVTREPLSVADLRANRALQTQIDHWKSAHRMP